MIDFRKALLKPSKPLHFLKVVCGTWDKGDGWLNCQRAGRCSSMPFSKSTCVEVPQAEASSVLARIEDLQSGFDLTTFPQSSGVSISWEQKFEISEGMFEILDLQILNLQNCQCFMDNIHMHTVQLKNMFNLSLTCHALTTCSFCNLFTWPKHGF